MDVNARSQRSLIIRELKQDVNIRIQCITCGTLLIIKSINSIIDVETFQNDNILVQCTHKTQLNGDSNEKRCAGGTLI
jgi:ubiquitin C-terminal hydrolase